MREFKISAVLFYFILSIVLLFFQSFSIISIASIYPDFLLLLTIIYALSRGSFKGELLGFGMGISFDLMSGALFGLNAFIFTLIGAFATPFQRIAKVPNLIVFISYIIICTIVKYISYHIFFVLYHDTSLLDLYYFLKIPGEVVINIIFGMIIYVVCARFDHREGYDWF